MSSLPWTYQGLTLDESAAVTLSPLTVAQQMKRKYRVARIEHLISLDAYNDTCEIRVFAGDKTRFKAYHHASHMLRGESLFFQEVIEKSDKPCVSFELPKGVFAACINWMQFKEIRITESDPKSVVRIMMSLIGFASRIAIKDNSIWNAIARKMGPFIAKAPEMISVFDIVVIYQIGSRSLREGILHALADHYANERITRNSFRTGGILSKHLNISQFKIDAEILYQCMHSRPAGNNPMDLLMWQARMTHPAPRLLGHSPT